MTSKYRFLIILLLIAITFSNSFAQDNRQAGLPEGAIARLGKGGINIIRFSPDGTQLAVGTDVGLWLYDVADGKETALFTERIGHVNALAFSSDGKMLASGGFNTSIIQIWDVKTKSKLSSITLTYEDSSSEALTFYGRTLISINGLREISYWHVDTGRKLSMANIPHLYERVAFSQDGSKLAIANRDGKIHLWNTTTSSDQAIFEGHGNDTDSGILALAFSPDGKILASGGEDKKVLLWDTQQHAKLGTLSTPEGWITAIAFSPDGKTVASGDAGKVIKLWDVETQKEQVILTGHKNTISALTFAPTETPLYGRCLASSSADGTIRLWNPQHGTELTTLATGHTELVKAVAFSENDATLVTAAFNGVVDVWSLETGQRQKTFTAGQSDVTDVAVLSLDATLFATQDKSGLIAFSPDGFGFQSRTSGSTYLRVWQIATGEEISKQWKKQREASVDAAVFAPNHTIIALSGFQEIRGFHVYTGVELFHFEVKGPTFGNKPVFSPNGKWIAVGLSHGPLQVWNVETPDTPPKVAPMEGTALAFSPDSSLLVLRGRDGIYLWKFDETNTKLTVLPGDMSIFGGALTFSPDGKTLICSGMGDGDNPIQLRDVETGKELATLLGHTEPVETLVFSHDGQTLASGSWDGTVLLWDWHKIISKARENIED